MTVEEILNEAWVTLGEPSDLLPFTYDGLGAVNGLTQAGTEMLGKLNDAQLAIATWKFPDGMRLNFPELRDWFYIEAGGLSGTVDAGQVAPFDDLAGDFTGTTGQILTIGSESRLVLAGSATGAVLDSAFTVDPSGLAWASYKRVFSYSDAIGLPPGKPIALYGVYDFESRRRLSRFETATEDFNQIAQGAGIPNLARIRGQKIIFDVAPSAGRFAVEYFRQPTPLATIADESELPETYHEALTLYVEMWGFARMQENDSAYARKRDLEDFLRRRRMTDDLEDEKRVLKLTPKVEG